MEYEFPRWKALVPTLLPVLPLVLCVLSRSLWAGAASIAGIALSLVLGYLWCSCPGCGGAMLVRGGLSPFGDKPHVCRHCGAVIRLK